MKNLSDQFKPSSTFVDLDKPVEKEKVGARHFQLNEFLEGVSDRDRSFVFDSETARNFDQENIKKAKQGVKELVADAIAKAKIQAIEIKKKALEEGENTGYEEGLQKGFQKGENAAKEEYSPLLELLNDLIRDLSEFRTVMYPKVEKEMVGMVVSLTKKVLSHEMKLREDSVKQMILLAMNAVINKENMVIRIHPSDKKHAEEFRPELKSLFGEIKNIIFEENVSIERGGCVIETNFGTVDAGIEQLEKQIDKILELAPTVPELNATSRSSAEKISNTETEEVPAPESDSTENSPDVKESSKNPISTSPDRESLVNETAIKKPSTEKTSESTTEKLENTLATEGIGEAPTGATQESKIGENYDSETPINESPEQEIELKEIPKKLEDPPDSKEDG